MRFYLKKTEFYFIFAPKIRIINYSYIPIKYAYNKQTYCGFISS